MNDDLQREEIALIDEVDKADPEVRPWTTKPTPRFLLGAGISTAFVLFIAYAVGLFGGGSDTQKAEEATNQANAYVVSDKDEQIQKLMLEQALAKQRDAKGKTFSTREAKPTAKPQSKASPKRTQAVRYSPRPSSVPPRSMAIAPSPIKSHSIPRSMPAPQPVSERQIKAVLAKLGIKPGEKVAPKPQAEPQLPAWDISRPLEPGEVNGGHELRLQEKAFLAATVSHGTRLPLGATASGEMVTPVLWARDIDPTGDRYVIQLNDSLGETVPKGAHLIAKASTVSQSGYVDLDVESIVINGQLMAIAANSIKVMGSDGGFIQAKQKGGEQGNSLMSSLGLSLLSGASGAASGLVSTPGISFNGGRDPLSGFVDDSSQSLIRDMERRLKNRDSREPVFIVKPGTRVKVVVQPTSEV